MWVATQDLPRSAAHPFYRRLNQILERAAFDAYVERLCRRLITPTRSVVPAGRRVAISACCCSGTSKGSTRRAGDRVAGGRFVERAELSGLELHEAPPIIRRSRARAV